MSSEDEKDLYSQALIQFGHIKQTDMMIEECSELIQALLKFRRSGGLDMKILSNVREELADVEIMLNQMKLFYDDWQNHIGQEKTKKLDRLKVRIANHIESKKPKQ